MTTIYIGDNNNLGFQVPIIDIPTNVDDIEVLLNQRVGGTPVKKCVACQCPHTGIIKCQGSRTETLFIDRELLVRPKAIRQGVTLFMYDSGEELCSVVFRVKLTEQIHPLFGTAVSAASVGGAVAISAAAAAAGGIGMMATAIPATLLGLPSVPLLIMATGIGTGLAVSGAGIAKVVKTGRQVKAWKEARRGNAVDVANVVGIGVFSAEQQMVAIFGNPLTKQQAKWGWGTFVIDKGMPDYFYFVSGTLSDSAKAALSQFSRCSPKTIIHDLYKGEIFEVSDGKVLPHNTVTTKYELVHFVPDIDFDTPIGQDVPQRQPEQQNA